MTLLLTPGGHAGQRPRCHPRLAEGRRGTWPTVEAETTHGSGQADPSASIAAETELERRIMADPEWAEGARWGKPRRAHPEGSIAAHVAEVLQHVERVALDPDDRRRLRLVALVHDTFKHRVERRLPRIGHNHHGAIARRFAERYIDDPEVLDVIELHDEAYNAWRSGRRTRRPGKARTRAERLIERLGPALPFYLRFYRADNASGDKVPEPLRWFEELAGRR